MSLWRSHRESAKQRPSRRLACDTNGRDSQDSPLVLWISLPLQGPRRRDRSVTRFGRCSTHERCDGVVTRVRTACEATRRVGLNSVSRAKQSKVTLHRGERLTGISRATEMHGGVRCKGGQHVIDPPLFRRKDECLCSVPCFFSRRGDERTECINHKSCYQCAEAAPEQPAIVTSQGEVHHGDACEYKQSAQQQGIFKNESTQQVASGHWIHRSTFGAGSKDYFLLDRGVA